MIRQNIEERRADAAFRRAGGTDFGGAGAAGHQVSG